MDNGLIDGLAERAKGRHLLEEAGTASSDKNHGPMGGHNCVPEVAKDDGHEPHSSPNLDTEAMEGRSDKSLVPTDLYLRRGVRVLKTSLHDRFEHPEYVGVVGGHADKPRPLHRRGRASSSTECDCG